VEEQWSGGLGSEEQIDDDGERDGLPDERGIFLVFSPSTFPLRWFTVSLLEVFFSLLSECE
jgi:hypothetical protein